MQFNKHLGFRVGFSDKFRGNFSTCKTPNMVRVGIRGNPKISIELHPRLNHHRSSHRRYSNRSRRTIPRSHVRLKALENFIKTPNEKFILSNLLN